MRTKRMAMRIKLRATRQQCRLSGLLVALLLHACGTGENSKDADAAYVASIEQWQQERVASLTKPDGWLRLAGLFWLDPGEHRAGSASDNDVIFPAGIAPAYMGTFVRRDTTIWMYVLPQVEVWHGDSRVDSIRLASDRSGDPTRLRHGSLTWFVIEREGKIGIRLFDAERAEAREFAGIETFPIDARWRVQATLEPFDPPKMIEFATVLGTIRRLESPGALAFTLGDRTYRLEPTRSGEQLFIVFGDPTNGVETYGGGRYLYVDLPGEDGSTTIDFNKAYNPPCAFSEYSTCSLPPPQNQLPLKITAGEKIYAKTKITP